jgi:hypothetical protein
MKRLIWVPLAGFLLIAGAAVAAASPGVAEKAAGLLGQAPGPTSTTSPSPEDTDGAEDKNDDTDSDATTDGDKHDGREFGFHIGVGGPGEILDDVLSELVANGTITQAQADAITDALDQAVSDKQAELEAQVEQMKQTWEQIQGFLEDGVITSDELAQLPEDNPISNLEDILSDGQITQEELDSVMVGPHFMRGPGGPGHFHVQRMPGVPAPDQAPDSGSDDSSNS